MQATVRPKPTYQKFRVVIGRTSEAKQYGLSGQKKACLFSTLIFHSMWPSILSVPRAVLTWEHRLRDYWSHDIGTVH